MKKITVLIISRPFTHIGGVRTSLELLMKTINNPEINFIHVGVGKKNPKSLFWKRPWEYLTGLFNIYKTIKQKQPNIIHINPSLNIRSLPFHFALLFLLKLTTKTPVLIHFRGWNNRIGLLLEKKSFFVGPIIHLLNHNKHIIVLANSFKQQLTLAGIPSEKISVFPEMINPKDFHRKKIKSTLSQPTHILFLSRLVSKKGADLLLDAAIWCTHQDPNLNLKFTIAGDGNQFYTLKKKIEKNKLQSVIYLPGSVIGTSKTQLFLNADIFVFPSSYPEGFPMTILEAMSTGLPLIYTPIGALPDFLTEDNGICIDLRTLTPEKIGLAILELVTNPQKRQIMGVNNQNMVDAHFTTDKISKAIEELYLTICKPT